MKIASGFHLTPFALSKSHGRKPQLKSTPLREILFITSYPPRECGIATYTQDLTKAINEKFDTSFSIKICALETAENPHHYPREVKYVLDTSDLSAYQELAETLNGDANLHSVFVQHEFGLFGGDRGQNLLVFLCLLKKPVITTFHTILPNPDPLRKIVMQAIAQFSASVIVMTLNSAKLLESDYQVPPSKIAVIPHGTHLISSLDHTEKSARNHLGNRMVLTTFGLLSPGKSIETALDALPAIINKFPNVLYLIIGKTHPNVVKRDGEQYRSMLEQKVLDLNLQGHVRFINKYLPLADLLAYLQRTDIYLFTSKDPYQAVSGTFAYAMGCGCPVISTPIPHAIELLAGAGIIVDFQRADQLANVAIKLLFDKDLMYQMKLNALYKIRPTAWPNAALAHIGLLSTGLTNHRIDKTQLHYNMPPLLLAHIRKLTTAAGIIQFSRLSTPDLASGYTLDDNARALIAVCRCYEMVRDEATLALVNIYLNFVLSCHQSNGTFLNYVDADGSFNPRNHQENLEDANGRALWALGEFIASEKLFPQEWARKAEQAFLSGLPQITKMRSPRACSFVLKGLHKYCLVRENASVRDYIVSLADDLVAKYRGVSDKKWKWFEDYLTYANSAMPEALLCAYLSTDNLLFKEVARSCFDFFLGVIFKLDEIKVVSNRGWLKKIGTTNQYGEQPIDVAYTILALDKFCEVFPRVGYEEKISTAFDWFLGKNHLKQIMYNPVTGGCYDGLEEHHVNLNQGAESTISYLLSRMTMEKKSIQMNFAK